MTYEDLLPPSYDDRQVTDAIPVTCPTCQSAFTVSLPQRPMEIRCAQCKTLIAPRIDCQGTMMTDD